MGCNHRYWERHPDFLIRKDVLEIAPVPLQPSAVRRVNRFETVADIKRNAVSDVLHYELSFIASNDRAANGAPLLHNCVRWVAQLCPQGQARFRQALYLIHGRFYESLRNSDMVLR